jgi:replicative DNA helicase
MPNIDDFSGFIKGESEEVEWQLWFQRFSKSYVTENYLYLIDELKKEYASKMLEQITRSIDKDNVDLKDIAYKILKKQEDIETEVNSRGQFVYDKIDERLQTIKDNAICSSIPSGFTQLDLYSGTGGFNRKDLYLFFGRSGVGKSRVLFSLSYNLIEQGYTGLYFSFEMYLEQLLRMFDSRVSEISSNNLRAGRVDFAYYKEFLDLIKIKKYPLYFEEFIGMSNLTFIRSKVEEFKKTHGKLDFVVVDYIGQMYEPGYDNKPNMLGAIIRGLRNIAGKENAVMITAQQANRKTKEKEKDGDKVDTDNISGSDEIGANCDFVAYISRGKLENVLDMDILKNREGPNYKKMKFIMDFPINKMTEAIVVNEGMIGEMGSYDSNEKNNETKNENGGF